MSRPYVGLELLLLNMQRAKMGLPPVDEYGKVTGQYRPTEPAETQLEQPSDLEYKSYGLTRSNMNGPRRGEIVVDGEWVSE